MGRESVGLGDQLSRGALVIPLDLAFLCQRCEREEDDCACIGGPFVLEREPERDLLPAPATTGAPVDERCGFVWGGR